jgi:hypothetical protein
LGKEAETTLCQNVGKNFLAKRGLSSRNPGFGPGPRGKAHTDWDRLRVGTDEKGDQNPSWAGQTQEKTPSLFGWA